MVRPGGMSKIKRYLVGPGVRGCARSGTWLHRDPVAVSRVYQNGDKIRATYVKHESSRPVAVSSSSSVPSNLPLSFFSLHLASSLSLFPPEYLQSLLT